MKRIPKQRKQRNFKMRKFLKELAKTPRSWAVMPNGCLRMELVVHGYNVTCCPLTSGIFGSEPNDVIRDYLVFKELKIKKKHRKVITDTADNDDKSKHYDPKLRKQMLQACGLMC